MPRRVAIVETDLADLAAADVARSEQLPRLGKTTIVTGKASAAAQAAGQSVAMHAALGHYREELDIVQRPW